MTSCSHYPAVESELFSSDSDISSDDDSSDDYDYHDDSIPGRNVPNIGEEDDSTPRVGGDTPRVDGDGNNQTSDTLSLSTKKRPYTFKKRRSNPNTTTDMRKRWKSEIDDITQKLSRMKCCKKLKCLSQCNSSFLKTKMTMLRELTYEDRKVVLAGMMGSNGKFFFDGKQVCNSFIQQAFRFSLSMIASVRNGEPLKRIIKDSSGPESLRNNNSHTTSNSDRGSEQKDAIISCLERLAESCGDKMPDANEIHLPFFRKRDVYVYFKEEFNILYSTPTKCPGKSYFYRVWKRSCNTIKVRKLGRFAKCTLCEQLRKSIFGATAKRDHKLLQLLRQKKREHLDHIARERREYKKKRDKAKLQPERFLSIIIDGADQSAFGIPHFIVKTKDDRGHTIKVRLIGLLEHNQQNRLRLFTLTEEYPTGANHIIETLHRYLSERVHQSVLPRTLYIQVDNCTKENKNRYFLSYLECLLRWKVFDEIEVGFLPVGHTHEDIDQAFSRTSDRLRCNDAVTLNDLHSELRTVYNDQTTVGQMKNVVNWSGLCDQESCLTNIKHFSKFRYFKIFKSKEPGSVDVTCMIKTNATDSWVDIASLSPSKSIHSFSKFCPDLMKTPPLKIRIPDGKDKVTECLTAAESRIPNVQKMEELLSLRDQVFRERVEPFHWDPESIVEYSFSAPAVDENVESESDEGEVEPDTSHSDEEPINDDYNYEINSFIAVQCDDDSDKPFWIAKVNQIHKNSSNVVNKLIVHWFDQKGEQDVFNGKYFPSYKNGKKKQGAKKTPLKDEISVATVIIKFEALTKQHKLPAAVAQHLRSL